MPSINSIRPLFTLAGLAAILVQLQSVSAGPVTSLPTLTDFTCQSAPVCGPGASVVDDSHPYSGPDKSACAKYIAELMTDDMANPTETGTFMGTRFTWPTARDAANDCQIVLWNHMPGFNFEFKKRDLAAAAQQLLDGCVFGNPQYNDAACKVTPPAGGYTSEQVDRSNVGYWPEVYLQKWA